MPDKDYTDIIVVMDCSSSMQNVAKETEDGLKQFVAKQKELPGKVRFTLLRFSTAGQEEYVYNGVDIEKVKKIKLEPNGMTALLDAVGKAVDERGEYFAKLAEADRPGLVMVLIATDGGENDSERFTYADIKEKIERQRDVYKWQFTYLGADFDAVSNSNMFGMNSGVALNFAKHNTVGTYSMLADKVVRSRSNVSKGLAPSYESYTDAERHAAVSG